MELCILRLGPLRLFLGRELLLHLESDGIGIDLIEIGCIPEDIRAVRPRIRDEDGGFDQQTREGFLRRLGG